MKSVIRFKSNIIMINHVAVKTDYTMGFIGLGKMGWRMAELIEARIRSSGGIQLGDGVIRRLIVYDIREDLIFKFTEEHLGSEGIKDLNVVGKRANLVWIMIPHEEVSRVATTLAENMKEGIIIDGGNSDPRISIRLAEKLKSRGIDFVDVGCSGGPYKVGELSLMVGGDKRVYERILPLLKVFGEPFYVGPNGMGHLVKVANNDLEYILMAGIGEVIAWLRRASADLVGKEVDVVTALKAINSGLVESRLLGLAIEILEEDPELVERVKPYVPGGTLAAWTLEISKDFPIPFITLALLQRILSREEDYSVRLRRLLRDIKRLSQRKDERFSIQALIRNKFGGHEFFFKESG